MIPLITCLALCTPSAALQSQADVQASFVRPALPVLVGNRVNPVLRIDLVVGEGAAPSLEEVHLVLAAGSASVGIERVEVLLAPNSNEGPTVPPAGDEPKLFCEGLAPSSEPLVMRGPHQLVSGVNTLWVSVLLEPDADIDGTITLTPTLLRLAGGVEVEPKGASPSPPARLGVAVRRAGDQGAAVYRIPGLVTTPKGTLIAVYDVRWKGWGDLPGDLDVGMSRSVDGGRTWEAMRLIMDMGDDPAWAHDGVGDPSVLVDRATGRVYVLGVWSHGDRGWNGSGPGLTPEETGQLMLVHSDDEGATWSAPRNLTAEVKDPDWCFLLQGPGRGITMSDGTLVFPAQFQLSPEEDRVPYATVLWSDDHGASWHVGQGTHPQTTESAVVELHDGILMSNERDNRGGSRSIYTSTDLGASWKEHSTSRKSLPEPVCMASLIHVGRDTRGEADGVLLFSNPAVIRAPRCRMTIRASRDYGASWPEGQSLLLDAGRSAGYSCLTMIDEETVGILYEGSRAHLTFQRVPLAALLPN